MGRHLEGVVLAPERFSAEGVLTFDIPLRSMLGKPIVVMVPEEKVRESGIVIPDTVAAKYQPDYGVVFDPGGCAQRNKHCTCPGCWGLKKGDLVAIKPYTGAWFTHKDFDWIPYGRMVKILGSVSDWSDNILCKIDLQESESQG